MLKPWTPLEANLTSVNHDYINPCFTTEPYLINLPAFSLHFDWHYRLALRVLHSEELNNLHPSVSHEVRKRTLSNVDQLDRMADYHEAVLNPKQLRSYFPELPEGYEVEPDDLPSRALIGLSLCLLSKKPPEPQLRIDIVLARLSLCDGKNWYCKPDTVADICSLVPDVYMDDFEALPVALFKFIEKHRLVKYVRGSLNLLPGAA